MAAATATILASPPDFASMEHRTADPHRHGKTLRSQRSAPSPSTPASPFRLCAASHSPSIPHRRVYNIDDESSPSPSQSVAPERRSSSTSLTPSLSASHPSPTKSPLPLALPLPPGSPTPPLARNKSPQRSSRTTRNQHLTNLQAASLSTPELHLASDPMLDTQEPSFLPKLVRALPTHSHQAISTARSQGQATAHTPSDSASPYTAVKPGLAYASFRAAMDAVDSHNHSSPSLAIPGIPGIPAELHSRKQSTATLRSADSSTTASSTTASSTTSSSTTSSSWTRQNVSTDTLSPPKQSSSRPSSAKGTPQSKSSGATWFRRNRNQGKTSGNMHSNSYAHDDDAASTPVADSCTQISMQPSQTSAATAGSGTIFLSESNLTMLSTATDASFGMSDLASPQAALDSIRKARSFMINQLARLSEPERSLDEQRISALVSQMKIHAHDPSIEASRFWHSIADGVLLCLLANRLRPGSVDRIDRRHQQCLKADNISSFLRAARDHLGLRSKDLFQSFDLTDGTLEGLLRVVHTLQAADKMIKRTSKVSAARANAIKIEPRTTSMTPPSTLRAQERKLLSAGNGDLERIDNSSELSLNQDTPKRTMLTIQQNRREAERILMGRSHSSRFDSSSSDSKRPSIELGYAKQKASSITFADSVKQKSYNGDEEGRMPYRDRKLSESAISLTGVAEEPEDGVAGNGDVLPTADSFSSTRSSAMERGQGRRGSSESDKSSKNHALRPVMLARSTSQKRISQELALGQLPRAVIGSTENLDDYLFTSGSPSRHAPTRRHSARLYPGPSLLNPSRESLLNLCAPSTGESDVSPSARVPFPRGTNDSPGARRMAPHLSINAGSVDSFSLTSGSGPGPSTTTNGSSGSPKLSSRPQFRHMRYSSDLHLPLLNRPTSIGARSPDPSLDERSYISTSRSRFDSEIGSIYTNPLGSLTTDENGSAVTRASRDATGPKHKLVVTEAGKNITYQLGNCIGRGQFGSVYRALNLNSGQMVAVKRIKLEGRTDDEVTELMGEVDLLKSLTHPSVVKYEGLVRGPDVVSIILEYVENGSLLHTLKAFGNFPEKLVASYVVKILEGLNYLHEQNVVHCDLKAANILTTKNGNVKLSDFGVSLNLKAVKKMGNKNDAIGTPNWMAPEVIELKGVTTAADIWSLGCTIIELITGKPPYYDMLAMSAMFRIVEDDCPPIPEKCSDALRDLLLQCFNKDPTKRPSAETLFEHQWIRQVWTGHKELRPQDSVPFLRRISADVRRLDPRIFEEKEETSAAQPATQRSSCSPPRAMLQRPDFQGLRAHTSPAESSAGSVTDKVNGISPTTSPPNPTSSLPSLDTTSTHASSKATNQSASPTLTSPTLLSPMANSSLLDLGLIADEQAKPHAFVKSTFSKAVICKICRKPVKKHAVLCEECGLVCHARCAVHAPSPCNLRAQLLLFQQRASLDQTSPVLSAAHLASVSPLHGSGGAANGSAPINLRFPFGMKRQSKSPTVESQPQVGFGAAACPENETGIPPSPRTSNGALGGKPAKDPNVVRKRRISLIPGRQRSPTPSPESTEALRSAYGNAALHGVRRHSSMSYGSISGNSSFSSGGGHIIMGHSSSRASSSQQQLAHQQQQGFAQLASTPVLPMEQEQLHDRPPMERFRRRLSSGIARGAPDATPSAKMGKAGIATGQVRPTPQTTIERKNSRRVSSKSDCIVM
ncbi:related to ser/thr protein kinase [Ustilago bromivora]|uniref:non-specific serine/threonine protein kinase n=1 Tax=Ustilago bromivora TaxID=307758 RepID=A0A1K0GHU8_9BASI|nr:related to ser/thr protein kinase [Ustilago bromivora]SYW81010.1 related to ser/thr protein kinase [Ustilago bromivora]